MKGSAVRIRASALSKGDELARRAATDPEPTNARRKPLAYTPDGGRLDVRFPVLVGPAEDTAGRHGSAMSSVGKSVRQPAWLRVCVLSVREAVNSPFFKPSPTEAGGLN
jgi:hypothetical protein